MHFRKLVWIRGYLGSTCHCKLFYIYDMNYGKILGMKCFWDKLSQNFGILILQWSGLLTVTDNVKAYFLGSERAVFGMEEQSVHFRVQMSQGRK